MMRTILATMALAALALVGCDSLAVVDGQSVCDLAAQHVAACNGQSATAVTTCDAQAEVEANAILGLDCGTLKALGGSDAQRSIASLSCDVEQQEQCREMCVQLFNENGLRLKRATCEIVEATTSDEEQVHCQCKGYWLPW
jgi:hypothetical protein